jgi:hypothetical protein
MAKMFDSGISGLNELLRDLKQLGPDANKELRSASKTIAESYMVPAWKNAALFGAGPWGEAIADSVRAGSDRLPKVMIGKSRKELRGGASSTMVRYPSDSGQTRNSFAPFEKTDWINRVRSYQKPALEEWGRAVDRVVMKWNVL